MPAPRRRIPGARRRWSGAGGDPRLARPDTFAPLPLDIATLSLGFFFFFFASLELNDISSSAGAAGRPEIVQREAWEGSSRLCGKGEGILLENPFFSRKIAFSLGKSLFLLENSLCRRRLGCSTAGGGERGKLESLGSGVWGMEMCRRCPGTELLGAGAAALNPAWKKSAGGF